MKNFNIKGGLTALLVLLLAGAAFASGYIKIEKSIGSPDCTITGVSDPKAAYLAGELKFYNSASLPTPDQDGTPLVPYGTIDELPAAGGKPAFNRFYFAENLINITVRYKAGGKYGYGTQGYSDDKTVTQTLALGSNIASSMQWLKNFSANYFEEAPNAPTIGSVVEASQRDGSTTNQFLTLTVPVVCSETTPKVIQTAAVSPGTTKYSIDVTYPGAGGTATKYTNGTLVLSTSTDPLVIAGTYQFVPKAYNWFGSTVGAPLDPAWTTLTGGTGGPTLVPVTWYFKRPSSGINTLSIPFTASSGIWDGTTEITTGAPKTLTVQALIEKINEKAAQQTVKVFGWYDADTQKHVGLTAISYSGTAIDTGLTVATGDSVANILAASIVQDRPYQVSVDKDAFTMTLTGYK
ncbi:MAG: hypothetical protein WC529_02935 [Candidatus Margulisiibacteriota bacterium]